jgi:predicted RNA-binding protein with PUA-like domain
MKYWLMKSEPHTYSIDDLKTAPQQRGYWEGVRNYQARNFMRDEMQLGDKAFFYHSSCEIPGIVGIMDIIKTAYPDFTAFDPHSPYYDPKSTPEKPRWFMVDVQFSKKFKTLIPLARLKSEPKLKGMRLLQPGNRLSILPVTKEEWALLLTLGAEK